MKTQATYNRLAARSIGRLSALSDGVFAIAMTLLVLDLRMPLSGAIDSEEALLRTIGGLGPEIVSYLMTFITLGIFWVGQQFQFDYFIRGNRHLTWIHLAFLFFVTMMPFSTKLLSEFITFRTALLVYWCNILLLGTGLYASWVYAHRAGLLNDDVTPEIDKAVRHRTLIAQAFYAAGAALCVLSTWISIAVIIAVQLTPRFRSQVRR